jgi:DNA-binding response OmpR family regulator
MTVRVLIVEDEVLIGLDLADQLSDAGFAVVGIATSTAEGMSLFSSEGCDIALLDVNLGTESSAPLAHELVARQVPFIAVTGYSADQCPPEFKGTPLLVKPIQFKRLIAEIHRCVGPTL